MTVHRCRFGWAYRDIAGACFSAAALILVILAYARWVMVAR